MKNVMKTPLMAMLVVIGLVLGSCSDNNETTNAGIKLDIVVKSTTGKINSSGRTKASELEFNTILLGLTELELETSEENEQEEIEDDADGGDGDGEKEDEEIEFEGAFVVDLIAGTSTPDFGIAEVIPGTYEEIELELGPILEGGNSLFISMTYTPEGGTPITIEYSLQDEFEFEVENQDGFILESADLTQILVLLNLDTLFNGVDFSLATADTDGVVRINGNSNADIAAQIGANLDNVLDAGEDEDDDDEIDG